MTRTWVRNNTPGTKVWHVYNTLIQPKIEPQGIKDNQDSITPQDHTKIEILFIFLKKSSLFFSFSKL